MSLDAFNTNVRSRREIRVHHWTMMSLVIAFNWILWTFVNLPIFVQLSGKDLMKEMITGYSVQLIGSILLFELSLLYIKGIVDLFWHRPKGLNVMIAQVVILAVLNGISSVLVALLFFFLLPGHDGLFTQDGLFTRIVFSDYIILSIFSTTYLVVFLMNRYRRESYSRAEVESRLREKENILLKTLLKNLSLQTNNHFVFNCFSTLSGLIRTDPDSAETFLQGLSRIYRYLVAKGGISVVPLREELALVNDYASLIQYRYSGISVTVDKVFSNIYGYVCPVSLQGLVENAVKHNRHGKDNRLEISIRWERDYIVVSNNILPREDEALGTGTGMDVLKDRYSLLTDKEVKVIEDEAHFEVRIPILYLEDLDDESIDN